MDKEIKAQRKTHCPRSYCPRIGGESDCNNVMIANKEPSCVQALLGGPDKCVHGIKVAHLHKELGGPCLGKTDSPSMQSLVTCSSLSGSCTTCAVSPFHVSKSGVVIVWSCVGSHIVEVFWM